jgi:hypothetical protein
LNPQTEKVKTTSSELIVPAEDDQVFYYSSGMGKELISARMTAWKEGRRKLVLYSPGGEITFIKEDYRLSFHDISEIKKFHPNGAVELIHIQMNPGASMYWYDTVISFGIGNEPEWKVENKHPSTLEEYMNSKYYWDKSTRTWKKQEYIREQEVPRE